MYTKFFTRRLILAIGITAGTFVPCMALAQTQHDGSAARPLRVVLVLSLIHI